MYTTNSNVAILNDIVLHRDAYEKGTSTFVIVALGEFRLKMSFVFADPHTMPRPGAKAGLVEVSVFSKTEAKWNELFSLPIDKMEAYDRVRVGISLVKYTTMPEQEMQAWVNEQMGQKLAPILDFALKQASTILL